MSFTLSVDAMGGDLGPRASFQAVARALDAYPQVNIQLFIDEPSREFLDEYLSQYLSDDTSELDEEVTSRLTINVCQQVVGMSDKPSMALRHRQRSSMAEAIKSVQQGSASACFSCGNTGALMVLSRYFLRTCIGIDRPALATDIPMGDHHVLMLDLGANVDASADQLIGFAMMAIAWRRAQGIVVPKAALLNIGKESNKGTEEIRLASQYLTQVEGIEYVGYLEGTDIYKGLTDVLVCDGSSGNIALKTSEGLLEFVQEQLRQTFSKSILGKSLWKMIKPYLKTLQAQLDPVTHSGAILLGLDGLVVKGHGNSTPEAIFQAIKYTIEQLEQNTHPEFEIELSRLQDANDK